MALKKKAGRPAKSAGSAKSKAVKETAKKKTKPEPVKNELEKSEVELYRKYRPLNFADIVGNEKAVKSVKADIKNGSHVFLFTGNAGCGKTTLARIASHAVGANDLSIHEINSAENRGIETAREIMQQMVYKPTDGKASAWILDEFHQQTKAAMESFLKPLEDTPKHVYFFICTTNPEKIIAPLKSRCSVIHLNPLDESEMFTLLDTVAGKEGVSLDKAIKERIYTYSDGSPRTALKILNRIIRVDPSKYASYLDSYASGDFRFNKETIDLCRALISKRDDWYTVANILQSMDLTEPERVRYAVLGYCNSVILKKNTLRVQRVMKAFSKDTYTTGKFGITLAAASLFSTE
jgi:DNA polymerase III gamma/tau subunit